MPVLPHRTCSSTSIETTIRDRIRTGHLRTGAVLAHQNGRELGVSRGVVVEAYQQLTAEGYVTSRPGGYAPCRGDHASTSASVPHWRGWPPEYSPAVVDTHEAKRIQQTNYERQALASSQGWGFAQDAPELLDKWPLKPFSEIGDKRMAFGVVSGMAGGVAFTTFDYHRRPTVTNWQSRGRTTMSVDTILIDTVWVLTLPSTLPKFQIFDSAEPNFDTEGALPPQTADAKVNRSYLLVDTDPQVATQLLTPAVTGLMKQYKLHNWATWGDQLLCVKHPIFGRVKPDELSSRVTELGQLIGMIPPHLWGAGHPARPPQQPAAPQQYPPQYQQPQYQQPFPQQGYPPQPYYPQQPYPPQPYPQQPYPPQPQPYYPPQPGYPPQGWR